MQKWTTGKPITQQQDTYYMPLYMTSSCTLKLYACKLELNGISCEMEIDTGCSSSLISEKQFNELLNTRLKGGNTEITDLFRWGHLPKGVANLNVKSKGKMYSTLSKIVPSPVLQWPDQYHKQFERRWKLNLIEWLLPSLSHQSIFHNGLLLIVPFLKRNSQVRICGDLKQTVNPVLPIDKYPILNIDDLKSKVSWWGDYFTRLDFRDAYLQVPLNEESERLTTMNTHKHLFMYTWLRFGIASSLGVFQRIIDQLIQGIPKTVAYVDDILIPGQTMEERNSNLRAEIIRC